jgi:hypothetical protein
LEIVKTSTPAQALQPVLSEDQTGPCVCIARSASQQMLFPNMSSPLWNIHHSGLCNISAGSMKLHDICAGQEMKKRRKKEE